MLSRDDTPGRAILIQAGLRGSPWFGVPALAGSCAANSPDRQVGHQTFKMENVAPGPASMQNPKSSSAVPTGDGSGSGGFDIPIPAPAPGQKPLGAASTLVIGYGNPIRSDDGVGIYIADQLESLDWPQLEIRTAQQLPVEWLDHLTRFQRVILIDASEGGVDIQLREVRPSPAEGLASSHRVTPEQLLRLARITGAQPPRVYLLTVRGEDFSLGEQLSPATTRRAADALRMLQGWLSGHPPRVLERRRVLLPPSARRANGGETALAGTSEFSVTRSTD